MRPIGSEKQCVNKQRLKPHLNKKKWGLQGYTSFFSEHRLWVRVRTAVLRLAKIRKKKKYKISSEKWYSQSHERQH